MTDIEKAREILEANWGSQGQCESCGWHASLYEHGVEDADILDALQNGGVLELACLNKDDENAWDHRGVRVSVVQS